MRNGLEGFDALGLEGVREVVAVADLEGRMTLGEAAGFGADVDVKSFVVRGRLVRRAREDGGDATVGGPDLALREALSDLRVGDCGDDEEDEGEGAAFSVGAGDGVDGSVEVAEGEASGGEGDVFGSVCDASGLGVGLRVSDVSVASRTVSEGFDDDESWGAATSSSLGGAGMAQWPLRKNAVERMASATRHGVDSFQRK